MSAPADDLNPAVPITPPIFVTADEPLLIFTSAEQAARWLEWRDVEDGLYRGFDSAGRLVEFGVRATMTTRRSLLRRPRQVDENVVVYTVEEDAAHADELRAVLTRVLLAHEANADELTGASLSELEERAIDHFGLVA